MSLDYGLCGAFRHSGHGLPEARHHGGPSHGVSGLRTGCEDRPISEPLLDVRGLSLHSWVGGTRCGVVTVWAGLGVCGASPGSNLKRRLRNVNTRERATGPQDPCSSTLSDSRCVRCCTLLLLVSRSRLLVLFLGSCSVLALFSLLASRVWS